jgi:hypothetical protein
VRVLGLEGANAGHFVRRAGQLARLCESRDVKLLTVTGEIIRLSRWAGCSLNYVIECGQDWVADVSLTDGVKPENHRKARVFASQNSGVANLMRLAHERRQLVIKSPNGDY